LKIRGKWGYELYDENGKRVRRVIEKQDGPKPKEGWYEVAKKAHRNACAARDKGEPLPFNTSRKTSRDCQEVFRGLHTRMDTGRSDPGSDNRGCQIKPI
jgi:hypothetical protein